MGPQSHTTYRNPVSGKRRDATELAALVELGISRGLDVVDAFMAVASTPASSRALAREHRRALQAQQRILRRHEKRVTRLRRTATGGTVVAGAAGSIGILDVAIEAGGSAGAFGPWPLWFVIAGVGGLAAWRARVRLRAMPSPNLPAISAAPPQAIPRSAIGSSEVSRFISVRMQLGRVASSVDSLHPGAGDELRRADAQAAGPLTALAERLSLLHQLQVELPNSTAADAARASAFVVSERLASGCATYEELLAAAARLLAAPDPGQTTTVILDPAVQAMVAYAHGLQRASDAFD